MHILLNKKITIKSILELITVIVVLLNSGYYRATATDSYIPLFLLIAISLLWITIRRKSFEKTGIVILIILLGGIAFSILANLTAANLLSGGRVAVTILCSFILVKSLSAINFTKYYVILIKCIIIFSIGLFLLEKLGVNDFPQIESYYDLLVITGKSGERAYGIFWEPGVFATMIVIAMLLEYFISQGTIKFFEFLLYIVGVLITKSTAGIMLLFIVCLGLIWRAFEKKNKNILYSILFFAVITLIAVFYERIVLFLVDINPDLFGKLIEVESDTTSTRLNGPLVNLRIFVEKPLFGWGFTESATEFFERMGAGEFGKIVAQTSTSTQILSSIGIAGAVYSLAFVFPIFNKKINYISTTVKMVLATCMLLIVNKEPHIFVTVSWMFLFYLNNITSARI